MRYWDSSALLPLLVDEKTTREMEKCLRDDPAVVTWWGTHIECASALARLERDDLVTPANLRLAFQRLESASAEWIEVLPNDDVRDQAIRLLRTHSLRAGEAMQVAAAVIASDFTPPSLAFVTLGVRQAGAVAREGFPLLGAV